MRKIFIIALVLVGFTAAGLPSFDCAQAATRSIFIGGGRTESVWYPIAQALAKQIKEKSKWLTAEVISTAGITGNVDLVKEKPKEYIGLNSFSHIHYRPGHSWGEKRGTYTGERFISTGSSMTQLIATYDPNIKKIQDLAGKIVDVGRQGAANTPDHKAILEKYGIADKVKYVYTGFGGGAAKLKDGLVDASFMLFNHIYPHKYSKGGFIENLETRGPIYYLGFDRNVLLELREKEYATLPVRVPAGALDPKTQPKALWAFTDPTFFFADKAMDDDVVYEVTRIIWETPAEEWAKWNPIGEHLNETFKPAMPSLTLYQPHPGAKKFYDEHGIELKDLAELLR